MGPDHDFGHGIEFIARSPNAPAQGDRPLSEGLTGPVGRRVGPSSVGLKPCDPVPLEIREIGRPILGRSVPACLNSIS